VIRGVDHLERNGVKGEELSTALDDPQNSVGVAIGGNGWGVTAGIFPNLEGSAEQSAGQRVRKVRRSIGGEVHGVVPVGRGTELDVVGGARDEREFLDLPTIVQLVHPHLVAIENVNDALLATGNEFMGIGV